MTSDTTPELAEAMEISMVRRLARSGEARRLREAAHLSLAEAASPCGVSKVTLSKWERGLQAPRGPAARRYAELLARLAQDLA